MDGLAHLDLMVLSHFEFHPMSNEDIRLTENETVMIGQISRLFTEFSKIGKSV